MHRQSKRNRREVNKRCLNAIIRKIRCVDVATRTHKGRKSPMPIREGRRSPMNTTEGNVVRRPISEGRPSPMETRKGNIVERQQRKKHIIKRGY